jgi:hypothetical protein
MNMTGLRTTRDTESRATETRAADSRPMLERPLAWSPPQLLPDPTPEPGYAFRWIRLSTLNVDDPMNISSKFREGWEPVKASQHPEVHVYGKDSSQFSDSIIVGGLMLCKTPVEFVEQRDDYYRKQADNQMASVDNTYMRENDPRMPLFKERSTKVTFGKR